MADLYEMVEQVQVMLASSQNPDKGDLRRLHAELDGEIRKANKRLRECDALLANGHRSEAIQLAEQEPELLDVVSVLDFAELPEWNDFVAELGLTVTPELHIDIASDLNRAYSEDAPLETHLRRFRLYSLARAPLRSRINILKKIRRLDEGNPVWDVDLRKYEEARLRQIKDEFRDADHENDVNKLRELASEVCGQWLVEPNRQLINRINQSVRSLNLMQVTERLSDVARKLIQAQEAGDLDWALELAEEWDSLNRSCSDASVELDELRAAVRRPLNWAQQQQAYFENIDRLRRSLYSSMNLSELRNRYAAARANDRELPADLQQEYDAVVLKLTSRSRNRKLAMIGGGVLLVLLAIFVVWYMLGSTV